MRYISIFILALAALSLSCNSSLVVSKDGEKSSKRSEAVLAADEDKAAKLTSDDCIDPDLSLVSTAAQLMLCDGTLASGTYTPPTPDFPAVANVLASDTVNGVSGTYTPPTPNEWDLRYGVVVGTTTGKLKMNCRNRVDTGTYNYDVAVDDNDLDSIGTGSNLAGTSFDWWDTIDDKMVGDGDAGFPAENPWGDQYACGYGSIATEGEKTWEHESGSGSASVFKDRITNLQWTRGDVVATKTWNVAIDYCANEIGTTGTFESESNWRLPTQKELMEAYAHGIHDLDSDHTTTNHLGDLDLALWSSSTQSDTTTQALRIALNYGITINENKSIPNSVLCVAP